MSILTEIASTQSAQIQFGYLGWPSTGNWCCRGRHPPADCSKRRRSQSAAGLIERSTTYSVQFPVRDLRNPARGLVLCVLLSDNELSLPICTRTARFFHENCRGHPVATRLALRFSQPGWLPV
ncbi:hypothetical protein G3N57_02365 [Paraburkholderia sp. Se-20369]|nr:hypothetical protein [Paraburkholderia sp. Se-20369]